MCFGETVAVEGPKVRMLLIRRAAS